MLVTKIEVREACDWLRAAGFPQYLQLFCDGRFPIDLDWARQDHRFLDDDALDSLCRRLKTLNKCAAMKMGPRTLKRRADDNEDVFTISPNWTYNRSTRQWQHLDLPESPASLRHASLNDVSDPHNLSGSSTEGPVGSDRESFRIWTQKSRSLDSSFRRPPSSGDRPSWYRDKPQRKKSSSLLKRMEKLRLRGAGSYRDDEATSGVQEEGWMTRSSTSLPSRADSGVSSSSPASSRTISSSSSQSESSSVVSTPSPVARVRSNCKRYNSGTSRDLTPNVERLHRVSAGRHDLVFEVPDGHKPGTFPTSLACQHPALSSITLDSSVTWRTGSFHGCHGRRSRSSGQETTSSGSSPLALPDHRMSVYDNVFDVQQVSESEDGPESQGLLDHQDVSSALDSVLERISGLQQLLSSWSDELSEEDGLRGDDLSSSSSLEEPVADGELATRPQRSRGNQSVGSEVDRLSITQMMLLQKLSLLRLTALMDKHSPASKRGWNWTLPKPLKKDQQSEVKGTRVFGAPLHLSVKKSGEPLPQAVLGALDYLRTVGLHQVGLFRKSGLKSRIQTLREQVESDPEVSFHGHSAYDVADLLKQYFRDLPESLFTSRLCQIFLHIYQYLPKDQQLEATQAAILLLPDEHRGALQVLLHFLSDVASIPENQMTSTNIAVCLAPSLFHLNTTKRDPSRSRHRKLSLGRPDQRDLSETLAATQGLAFMISEAERLFQLPEFWPGDCSDSAASMGAQEEQLTRLHENTQILLDDAEEKSPGWRSRVTPEHIELSFKKVDDSCPLWLWRGRLEVKASTQVLMQKLLKEPNFWDCGVGQATTVTSLSENADVILVHQAHGACWRPLQEQLLIRTWRSEGPGPLFISCESTEHLEVPEEGVREHIYSCLFLLEPTGTGTTLLTHICRTDTRGRSLEWHCRVSGHHLAAGLLAIRDFFRDDNQEA
ncbi:rho GTPase-activating protein 7 [Synchiropus picturatus]